MMRQRWSTGACPPLVSAALLLLVLTGIFFMPLLWGRSFTVVASHQHVIYPWAAYAKPAGFFFPQSDQADLDYPWHVLLTRALDEGTLPFWNPYSYAGGQPLYTNGSSALIYPPRLLLAALVSPDWAHDLFSFFHVFLAGLFTLVLLREYGAGWAASLLAAISWMFSGFVLAWLHHEIVVPTFIFIPLLVFCVARTYRTRTWRMTVVTALALATGLMSSYLIFAGLTYLCAISYAVALGLGEVWQTKRQSRPKVAARECGRLGLMVGLSLMAASVLLIPTALTLADSQRDPFTYATLKAHFLASWDVFQYSFYPPSLPISDHKMHKMAFAGTLTAGLAIVSALTRRRGARFGLCTYLIVALVATGTPLTWLVFHVVPGFDVFRPYSRLLMFSSFATAVLGGLGLDVLIQTWHASWSKRFAAWPPRRSVGLASGVVALIIALTALQLMIYGRNINPPFVARKPENFYPAVPLIRALQDQSPRHGWPARVMPIATQDIAEGWTRPMLFAAQPLVHAIDSAIGYDSVVPRRTSVIMRILAGQEAKIAVATGMPSAYVPVFYPSKTRYDLAERLGITLLATPPDFDESRWKNLASMVPVTKIYAATDGKLYRIDGSRAGPRLLYEAEIVESSNSALFRFVDKEFPFKSKVLLERAEIAPAGLKAASDVGSGPGEILAATRTLNSATIRAKSTTPAWLVMAETWAPGWTATVNGKSAAVLRGNYVQRVVRVPAGESTVQLTYRPPAWSVGLSLTAGGWLAGLIGLGFLARERRSQAKEPTRLARR